ncbi:MAG: triose-phosphate isomerase [Candidatus Magasanikbacteria bacterium]|uniref:Triosephosphate isomerase n=1 Tax=Candidatus Magasanikbacteria bacterium CG10_big_fil_rev_8_21_14_0_10_38_6 TaxID=1974647 RepID=A0A2M6P0P7_9BACT|nr:triose-phosphate isomerase [Candidatus Magasanikbacteria bacterium]NCS71720.1 triose-phosphate isomerase [Candidatus Magasanikbacteria bacterium]PIR77277.1 MAG: triose-phosphate isomerase [Candidatus Magasanikbacteria bacterium CG10_big_fil_rev_8_21_14_0_10_38_6]
MNYIFANWKMYLDFDETMILAHQIIPKVAALNNTTVAIFPNTLAISEMIKATQDTNIAIGAQTINWVEKGAYTGAVSAHLVKEIGCQYALVGHSERRYIFGETNEDIRKKIAACLDEGITPVLCVGETQEDKDNGKEEYRIKKQLKKALEGLEITKECIIAYEPVWAVGTGNECDPELAEEKSRMIRTEVAQYTKAPVRVLYGGSVDASNVVSYIVRSHIDGVLIGSASAKEKTCTNIINALTV